ncbi:sodium/potassium/calcium exchanger 2-like [Diorhabda sublineata]|uniref:sodium/potassium/calcium exchanger 2-like n=1 Tax=Diorhabda sublineata TaxID=1163346 RepID=UPI0024E1457D|nr:sodium/potassium/calcium exchanger 2-like [Diorhabda sublineata]
MTVCVNFMRLVAVLVVVCYIESIGCYDLIEENNETTHDIVTEDILRYKRQIFFVPFARPYSKFLNSTVVEDDDDNFPQLLTEDQILKGGIILVIFIGIYGFTLLAVVCNDYFLPCVEAICKTLNLTPDVAAATFMSIATSTPEFFTNIISTFISESNLGIGTIVGSLMCNTLLVPAVGGLNSPYPLQLDWYPLSRDTFIYILSVTVLIFITWDSNIFWYESLIPLTIYVCYFAIMFNNKRIHRFVKRLVNRKKINISDSPGNRNDISTIAKVADEDVTEEDVKKTSGVKDEPKQSILSAFGSYMKEPDDPEFEIEHQKVLEKLQEEDKQEAQKSLFRRPEGNFFKKFIFYYTWPTKLITRCTIPNPLVYPHWFPVTVTFFMCIVWIGLNSYIVCWMISIIGQVTNLPDALLGMTLMAVGGCLPETVSMTIIARRGEGSFGVSNSLGANTMNVLYSLGIPWFLKNIIQGFTSAHPVLIKSGSIEYTIMSLIIAAVVLYLTLLLNKFRLSKISGVILGVFYICMVTSAIVCQTVLF